MNLKFNKRTLNRDVMIFFIISKLVVLVVAFFVLPFFLLACYLTHSLIPGFHVVLGLHDDDDESYFIIHNHFTTDLAETCIALLPFL